MKKKNINITLDCKVFQENAREISKFSASKWDTISLTYNVELTGIVLQKAREDDGLRQEIKDRIGQRFEELMDSMTLTD